MARLGAQRTRFLGTRILALCAVLWAAAGCAVPNLGVQGLDNASASMAIKSRMLRSETDFSGVDVRVVDGVALLIGHVPDEATKSEAGRIAWSAPNIRDVGNELEVNPEGRTLKGANDQLLLSQVRTRLFADRRVKATRIHVEVYNGVVYLLGEARTPAEADEIARQASVVPGVDRVVSFLGPQTAVPAVGVGSTTPYMPEAVVTDEAGEEQPPAPVEQRLLGGVEG